MLERIGAFAVMIASAAAMIGISRFELPAIVTVPLVFAAVIVCMGGIVVLYAEERVFLMRRRARKTLKNAEVSNAPVSKQAPDSWPAGQRESPSFVSQKS